MHHEHPEATPAPLVELDKPRTIALTIAGKPVHFTFGVIPVKAWRRALEAVVTRVEQRGEERIRSNDEATALVQLFGHCHQIEGYSGTEGLSQAQIAGRVPMRHRLAVTQVLRAVSSRAAGDASLSELAEVTLDAPWTIAADGSMQMFSGLIHRFHQPTIEQYQRWRMGVARTLVTGTAEDGVTIYPSRLAVALGLYDEMIAEVEGYAVNGKPLHDARQIAAHMDGMHKARAVLELFERDEEDISISGPPVQAAAVDEDAESEAE